MRCNAEIPEVNLHPRSWVHQVSYLGPDSVPPISPRIDIATAASMVTTLCWMLFLLAAAEGLPRCYPPSAPFRKPALDDCASVIEMMMEGDKTGAPMHFSRDPSQGFEVPHYWINTTCTVAIDLVKTEEAIVKLSEIAFTAATIMHLCIGRPGRSNLGGSDLTGPWQNMKVIVGGRKRYSGLIEPELISTLRLGWPGSNGTRIDDQRS
ncbi:MAG: hypothetical protein Q9170_007659 [Blastenia crenularia]